MEIPASEYLVVARSAYETMLILFGMSIAANAIGIVVVMLLAAKIRELSKRP